MNEPNTHTSKPDDAKRIAACGTNSTLNNTIGVLAIIAAGIIGYVIWKLYF